jgi:cell division cycle 2-like protein
MEDRRKEADARKKTREIEKEMYRLEEALKRKAEGRSRSSSREKKKKKKKRKKSETPEEESGSNEDEEEEVAAAEAEKSTEEGEEEEEEEEEEGSEEESSEEEESESEEEEAEGSDATTGSQKSEETPDREDSSEEGELENEEQADNGAVAAKKAEDGKEQRRRKRSRSPVEGKWADHSPDSDRTVSRSPTPLRAAMSDNDSDRTPRRQQFHEESALSRPSSPGGHHHYHAASPAAIPVPLRDELPPYLPSVHGCRSVAEFKCLNRIEEGTYGVVYRALDKRTQEVVALKRLKMEREKEGFPITSLREINTLLISQHPNVVTVREIVVGSNMDQIYIVMDFVHHDLKSLMETMRKKNQVFLVGEVKCLMVQLLRAIHHLHDNWILHRDLKASNLLLSHNGILKVR